MKHPKIMIVEDECLVARDIQSCLEELGFSISAIASSACLAIEFAERDDPDLIVMDIRLKGDLDGIYAAEMIRKKQEIPVLFLTSFADKEITNRAREVGSSGFLVKPFVRRQLQAMVEIALQRHQADQERIRLDERIRHSETLSHLQSLAGGVAHGFNNHIHSILGNLATAIKQLPADSPGLSNLEVVQKSAQSAAEWSKQLLVLSGTAQLELKVLDLSETVRKLRHLVEAFLPADNSIVYELSDNLPSIIADPAQLQQVMLILASNASEAMDGKSGPITIRTSERYCVADFLCDFQQGEDLQPGPYVFLEVLASGRVKEKSKAENFLDPFFRLNDDEPGFGLATVLGIVRAHHGATLLANQPGGGTGVCALFPVSNLKEKAPRVENTKVSGMSKSGAVLVADDDKMVLAVNKEMIEELGLTVFTALDGRMALDVLRKNSTRIAVVLLDLTMPYINGATIVEEFQSIHPGVKVVLTSGFDRKKAMVRFGGAGPDGFIQKPFQISKLEELFLELSFLPK